MYQANITHKSNTARLLRLVEEVKKRPILWDPDIEGYGSKGGKIPVWREIGLEVGYETLEAKSTWKKLRDIHRDSVKRRTNKLMQPWKFSKQMEFLLPHMKKRTLGQDDEVYRVVGEGEDWEEERAKRRRKRKVEQGSETESESTDEMGTLGRFFDAMEETTRKLPGLLQLEIKRKIFEVVSNAEETYLRNQNEDNQGLEAEEKVEVEVQPDLCHVVIKSEIEEDYVLG